jgi:hypothetical protein
MFCSIASRQVLVVVVVVWETMTSYHCIYEFCYWRNPELPDMPCMSRANCHTVQSQTTELDESLMLKGDVCTEMQLPLK